MQAPTTCMQAPTTKKIAIPDMLGKDIEKPIENVSNGQDKDRIVDTNGIADLVYAINTDTLAAMATTEAERNIVKA
jgi:hypothetical protein